jgi:hypothetical protein
MHRSRPVGTPRVRTPPPGGGISTRCPGGGRYVPATRASRSCGPCARKSPAHPSTVLPSPPGLPPFRFPRARAARRCPRSTTRAIRPTSPPAASRAARAAVQGRGLGPTAGAPSCPPFGPSARARGPPLPAADCGLPIGSDASARRSPRLLRAREPPADLPGSDTALSGRRRRRYQAHPRRGGRTSGSRAHASRVVPPLLAGSWASPRTCGWGCLQTSPRDDALALLLAVGAANTWHGDFHPVSSGPCLAHTPQAERRAVKHVRSSAWLGRAKEQTFRSEPTALRFAFGRRSGQVF